MSSVKSVGDLLVDVGIISHMTLERALQKQKESGKQIGVILESMGVVTEEEIFDVLSSQLSMHSIKNIRGHQFPEELLKIIPSEMALEYSIFPLRIRDGVLAIAVSEPLGVEKNDFLTGKIGRNLLPVLAPAKEIQAAINEYYLKDDGPGTISPGRILVVEDSPVVANVIKAALEKEGFEVTQAIDGLEGLKFAISSRPLLILCDAIMPRMDGYGMKRALAAQQETAHIPVILLTSKASPEEEQKALASGFFDFIAKPVNAIRIVSRIRRAIAMTVDRD